MRDAENTKEGIFQNYMQHLFRNSGQLEKEPTNACLED